MSRVIDLTGQRFGRLVVVARGLNRTNGRARWNCRCDCGNSTCVNGYDLRLGKSTNCGCVRKEKGKMRFSTHGLSKILAYSRWCEMKTRIRRDPHYSHLSYCPRWQSFDSFYHDMGDCPPGYSLERIDNNKGYSPENCKWIPLGHQAKNTSRVITFQWNGHTLNLSEWISLLKLNRNTVWARIYRGWPIAQALELELRKPNVLDHH